MNLFYKNNTKKIVVIFSFLAIILLSWALFFNIGNGFYIDPFHQGEYLASLQSKLKNIPFYSIHGGMDWLPGIISIKFFGVDRYFLFIKIIYSTLSLLACILVWLILLEFSQNKFKIFNLLVFICSPFLITHMVSYKDVFLIFSFFVFILLEMPYKTSRENIRNKLLELLLGFLLALNLAWSFERGLAALFSIGSVSAYYLFFKKQRILTFFSFLSILYAMTSFQLFSLDIYLENFLFLLNTASQWSYGYKKITPIFYSTLVLIPNFYAAFYLLKYFSSHKKNVDSPLLASMFILLLFMVKVGLNRPDFVHILMALWVPALIFVYLYNFHNLKISQRSIIILTSSFYLLGLKNPHNYWFLLLPILLTIFSIKNKNLKLLNYRKLSIIFLGCLMFFSVAKVFYDSYNKKYLWLNNFTHPPLNSSLVDPGVVWINSILKLNNVSCIFDMSNNGVINGISGLPSCVKSAYLVYATKDYETNIIEELKFKNPSAIISSTTFWSYSIDGRPMHLRFPKLFEYILKAYPYEECKFEYCLRYSHK